MNFFNEFGDGGSWHEGRDGSLKIVVVEGMSALCNVPKSVNVKKRVNLLFILNIIQTYLVCLHYVILYIIQLLYYCLYLDYPYNKVMV